MLKRKTDDTGLNPFNIPFYKAYQQTMDKQKNLLQNEEEVKKIITMWQCNWSQERKKKEVKIFFKNIFLNPPPYRLEAFNARK